MHIGIDISSIIYNTGVSRYTANLVRGLSHIDLKAKLTLYGTSLRQYQQLKRFTKEIKSAHTKLYPIPPKATNLLFNQLGLPIETLTGPLDVFHAWDWYVPKSTQAVVVTTVHDLALFKFPDSAHKEILEHHSDALKRALKRRLHLIAVSEATKQDLIELFGFNPDNIHVIPEALPEESHYRPSEKDVKEVHKKYAIEKPYILSVGTQEPRKNYPHMIQAWRTMKADYDYVIVGKPGWEQIPPQPGLHLIPSVNNLELAALYRGAEVLCYASLYEGFGLPILEAFYHRLPVVTSNTGSMPEVAGKAAVLVDPQSVSDIAGGIQTAINQKQSLIEKGTLQLDQFSWIKTAEDTLEVYVKAFHDRQR